MKRNLFTRGMLISLGIIILISFVLISALLVVLKVSPSAQTQTVAIQTISSQIQADGSIVAQNQATLHFQTGGKLVYLPFKVGDTVQIGQTIASLDETTLQKQLTAALNTYRSTRDTFDQTQQNQGNNVIQTQQRTVTGQSGIDYLNDVAKRIVDENQANLDNSVLNVEIANQAIQLASLTSPLNGVITQMDVTTPNVNVTPTTSFTVADPTSLVFRANVAETDIDYVTEGSPVTIKLGSNTKALSGTVSKIYPDKMALATGEKVYQVDVESSDLTGYGKMGETGTVLIQSNIQSEAKLVPTWTVLNHDSVWVLSNGKPQLRSITVGKTHGNMTEVLSGLQDGDEVITNPESVAARKYQIL